MSRVTMTDTLLDAEGAAVAAKPYEIRAVDPANLFAPVLDPSDDSSIVAPIRADSASGGVISADLRPNAELAPSASVYRLRTWPTPSMTTETWFTVGVGASSPSWIGDSVIDDPRHALGDAENARLTAHILSSSPHPNAPSGGGVTPYGHTLRSVTTHDIAFPFGAIAISNSLSTGDLSEYSPLATIAGEASPGAYDMSLAVEAGDIIVASVTGVWGQETTVGWLDITLEASGGPVRLGQGFGLVGAVGPSGPGAPVSPAPFAGFEAEAVHTIIPADITAGSIALRVYGGLGAVFAAETSKTLFGFAGVAPVRLTVHLFRDVESP